MMTTQPSAPLAVANALARPQIRALASSKIRQVANAAMGRAGILPFWFGESDQPTATFVNAEAKASLDRGETFYSQNLGRPYLRTAIADYLSTLHGRGIGEERIAVTGSGLSAIMICLQAILDPGDEVAVVVPIWPNIAEIPAVLGATVRRVPLQVIDGRWELDLDLLLAALTPGTKALIINSPNNPTGWTIGATQLPVILDHCRRHGIWILADEVYERLVFDRSSNSAPSLLDISEPTDRVIAINSFSKAWTMTGWRIGWATVPPTLIPDLEKLIEFNTSCVFEPVQRAALSAITGGEDEVAKLRSHLIATRRHLATALRQIPGIDLPHAGGAMYAFFRIAGYDDSMALAVDLVEKVGLGLAPGCAFGPEGEGWLRWCHATDIARLDEGIARLRSYLAER
jgi:aspartate/methionine/tyrosine aminotransferase